MKLYTIANWNEVYENSRSRTVKDLAWVPVPNSHDGEEYSRLVTGHKCAAEIFAAWILILQVASKCSPRGHLVRRGGCPHEEESLAMKTRAPAVWFKKALPYLVECGWLTCKSIDEMEFAPSRQDADTQPTPDHHPSAEERRKGREGKEGNIAPKPARARDPIFDAFVEVTGQSASISGGEIGKAIKAVRELTPDVTPDEIKKRADNYRTHFNDASMSSLALAKWWAHCAAPKPNGHKPVPWHRPTGDIGPDDTF